MMSIATVYKSGNSKVITIPSWMNLEIGDEVELLKDKKNFVMKKSKQKVKQTPALKLRNMLGKHPGITQGMNPEELDLYLEGIYD